jgi:hypothetical protein
MLNSLPCAFCSTLKPKKLNVSGLPSPRWRRFCSAKRPNSTIHCAEGYRWVSFGEKRMAKFVFIPDEAVVSTIRTVFSKFTELASVRKVWLWFRSQGLSFPLRVHMKSEIRWVAPTYTALHHVLSTPVYAGAYAYGFARPGEEESAGVNYSPRSPKGNRHMPHSQSGCQCRSQA